jgi:hypothetical protein
MTLPAPVMLILPPYQRPAREFPAPATDASALLTVSPAMLLPAPETSNALPVREELNTARADKLGGRVVTTTVVVGARRVVEVVILVVVIEVVAAVDAGTVDDLVVVVVVEVVGDVELDEVEVLVVGANVDVVEVVVDGVVVVDGALVVDGCVRKIVTTLSAGSRSTPCDS